MKKAILVILLLATITSYSQKEQNNTVSVTVYNSNLGVVKENRQIKIPKGISDVKITDVASQIDPTSVFVKLNGEVLEQNYRYDLVSMFSILDRYIDKEITLIGEKGNLSGTLLQSAGSIVLKQKDNSLLMLSDFSKYQIATPSLPDGLITRPTLVWKVETNKEETQNVELSYQTSGMQWNAEYVAVLNEKDDKIDLNAWVSVTNNSGATFQDAKLKLIAGEVNRVRDSRVEYSIGSEFSEDNPIRPKAKRNNFEEKSLFEYHIYDLQDPTTLTNKEIKQISLFSVQNIKVKKMYYFNNDYNRNSDNLDVVTFIEFTNSKENTLGMPMPAGRVRFNKRSNESLEFIGEDRIEHTPKDENIKLKLGNAFDIKASSKEVASERISDKVTETEFEIVIKNRKDENINVQVERHIGPFSKVLSSNIKSEQVNAGLIKFDVPCKKNSETKLLFKVRFVY